MNQKKVISSLQATITSGTATVHINASPQYYPGGWEDTLSFGLAGVGAKASGCSLKLSKAKKDLTLDCSKIKITLDQITWTRGSRSGLMALQPQSQPDGAGSSGREGRGGAEVDGIVTPKGDVAYIDIVLTGTGVKGSALLSSAVPYA